MIVGVGIDVVDISRFERQLELSPGLAERLFTPAERPLPTRSLAARFAAKEALMKALGDTTGFSWQDMVVTGDDNRKPAFTLSGAIEQSAAARGVTTTHLSLSHDAGVAIAFVVLEAE